MAPQRRSELKDLSDRLDRLTIAMNPQPQMRFQEIAEEAEAQALVSGEANWWHLAGLAWYESPNESSLRSQKVISCESKALEIDPTHSFAKQYLAYCLFDEGEYDQALEYLEQIDPRFFSALGQRWRVLKNEELVLSAKLYLNQQVSSEKLLALFSRYAAASNRHAPVPLEIARCFVLKIRDGDLPDRKVLRSFVQLVRKLDFTKALKGSLPCIEQAAI